MALLVAQLLKNLPAMQETWFDSWIGKIHWRWDRLPTLVFFGFSYGSAGKESAHNIGDPSSIPALGRSPGEGKGYSLQYSGLKNSMDYIAHRVTKSWILLREFHFHFPMATPSFPGHAHWSGVWCWVFAMWCAGGQRGCLEWQCYIGQWQGARFDLGPQAAVGFWLSMAHTKLFTFPLGIFAVVEMVNEMRSVMCRYPAGWTNSQRMHRDEGLPGMLRLAFCAAAEDSSGVCVTPRPQ